MNESGNYTEEKFTINDESIDRKNFLINENITDIPSVDTLNIMKKIYIDNNFDNIDNIKSLSVRNYLSEFVNKRDNIGEFFTVPLKREIKKYDDYKYEEGGFKYYYKCIDIIFSSKSKFFGFGKIDIKMDYVLENVVDNSIINLDTSITDGVVIEDDLDTDADAKTAINATTELYNKYKSLIGKEIKYRQLSNRFESSYTIENIRIKMMSNNSAVFLFKLNNGVLEQFPQGSSSFEEALNIVNNYLYLMFFAFFLHLTNAVYYCDKVIGNYYLSFL